LTQLRIRYLEANRYTDGMSNALKTGRHWLRLTPGRLIFCLIVAESLFWLSDRLGWPAWHKGYAVLSCIALLGGTILVMLVWWTAAFVFRRQFQFSIRSLLVLTVAAALPLSWLTDAMNKTRRQAKAVEAVQMGKGWVSYKWDPDADDVVQSCWSDGTNAVPHEPALLRNMLGDDFFMTVVDTGLMDDAQKEFLPGLPQLRRLYFTNDEFTHKQVGKLTDAGLEHVAELANLQTLCLLGNSVTDTGLLHVGTMSQLRVLTLDKTEITDAGLAQLARLTNLRELYLRGTAVTDAGVKKLQQDLPNCKFER
jgi:hypothetical protein